VLQEWTQAGAQVLEPGLLPDLLCSSLHLPFFGLHFLICEMEMITAKPHN
jgi:hypothetical protein